MTQVIEGSGARVKEGQEGQQGLHPFPKVTIMVRMTPTMTIKGQFLTCTDRWQRFFGQIPSLRQDPTDPGGHT